MASGSIKMVGRGQRKVSREVICGHADSARFGFRGESCSATTSSARQPFRQLGKQSHSLHQRLSEDDR